MKYIILLLTGSILYGFFFEDDFELELKKTVRTDLNIPQARGERK